MEFKDLIIPTINVNDTKVTISDIKKENLEFIDEDETWTKWKWARALA